MPTAQPGPWLEQALARGLIRPEQLPAATPARPLAADVRGVNPLLDAPSPDASEKEFQSKVVALAEANDWRTFHVFDSRRSAAGFPDLVLVRKGTLILAELKSDVGRLSAEQKEWLKELREVNGVAVRLWRPSLWSAIVAELTV